MEAILLSSHAVSYAEEFMDTNMKSESATSTSLQKWEPPLEPMFKMNVAWKSVNGQHSYGVWAVVRDHTRALLAWQHNLSFGLSNLDTKRVSGRW